MSDHTNVDFSGIWYCGYAYPSNQHKGQDVSEYYGVLHQRGNKLVFQSLPNIEESTMQLTLTVDGDLASGYWEEGTSPSGEFAGALYSGVVQLLINKDQQHIAGKWAGIGQEKGEHQIYTGEWTLRRAGAKELKKAGVSA